MHALTYRLNAYFAVFIITIFGSAAAMLIIHIAHSNTLAAYAQGSEAPMYSALNRLGSHK